MKIMLQLFLLIVLNLVCSSTYADVEKSEEKFTPDWTSLESRPLPEWFDSVKIGIFIHWGVYSVPSVTSEWFWLDWKDPSHNRQLHEEIRSFMKENYKPDFTYQDFATDFTAEFFNATEWADIFGKSGAKYIVLTSKHHEGFTLWPSKYSYSWNSVDTGPHRDIVDELAKAVRKSKYGIKFGLYHSLFEWFHPLYMSDKANNFTTQEFVKNKIMPEMIELVEKYKPEVFWSDGEEEAPTSYWQSKEFIAWLYNESPVKYTIVVNDRWGTGTSCKHGGYFTCADRYVPGKLQERKWENAMTIDKNTWGYSRRSNLEDYLTNQEIIDMLVQTIAFGGNLLVNVGPTKDGKITPIYEDRLLNMGKWLALNGEAIYSSTPWEACQNDSITPTVWYTKSKAGELFAIFLRWPQTSVLKLACPKMSSDTKVKMLGNNFKPLQWTSTDEHLIKITLPEKSEVTGNWGWTLKIDKILN